MEEPRPVAPLIDVETLARHLADPDRDLVVLDASAGRPGETHDPAENFRAAHVPGAQRFDLDAFSAADAPFPHTVPPDAQFARLAGALGIGDRSTVVVYEARRLFSAARAWFLFRLFGHDDVRLLDGGLPAWRAAGQALESGEAAARPPAAFTARIRPPLLAGLDDILAARPGRVVLDARSAARFSGTAPEPRPGIRSGHIPGSRNLPYEVLLREDGRLKDRDTLRGLFEASGAASSGPVVTSCGTGVTASVLALGLAVAGFTDVALYDGSWTEYASVVPARAGEGA